MPWSDGRRAPISWSWCWRRGRPKRSTTPSWRPACRVRRRLQPHAFVSPRHYTAHPYSSDAILSLLGGAYPHGRHLLLRDAADQGLNGLFSGLPPEIGWRGAYLPSLYQNEADDRMYRAFGARTLYVADHHPDDPFHTRAVARADAMLRDLGGDRLDEATRTRLHALLVGDLQALERLKADITRTMHDGGRYAVMFVPGGRPRTLAAAARRRYRRAVARPDADEAAGRLAERAPRCGCRRRPARIGR